ncbi:type II secretion system F family protein [Levilactobacillus tongjiangensis]|uniref:Type II secretion system F family protein n=1 Tax=Levilactobacillus tongjiangensis TaxID=2486023 RepID=A0ABW1SS85_9LACO|nr:type II secretion system F family protein [Levilactobacillus tongjiangensis]
MRRHGLTARFRAKWLSNSATAKWPLTSQLQFCQLLADQLASGFSLRQAIAFSQEVKADLPKSVAQVATELAAGTDFVASLAPYLQPNVFYQLRLTTTYGDLGSALNQAATLLRLMATQKKRLRQLLLYPLALLLGMLGLFVTLQVGILPQLQQEIAPQRATSFAAGQYLIFVSVIGLGCFLVTSYRWWRQQSRLALASWYLRLPLIGRLCRAYYAYYLAASLSQLVNSGLSVKQMVTVLTQLPDQALLHQLAVTLSSQLAAGQSPVGWLRQQAYVPTQLVILLQKGSTNDQLARELHLYSDLRYRELVQASEQTLALVQPILLTVVALMIVGAYLSLLLPMYANLQGVM